MKKKTIPKNAGAKINKKDPIPDQRGSRTRALHLLDSIEHNNRHAYAHAQDAVVYTQRLKDHLKKDPKLAGPRTQLYKRLKNSIVGGR